MDREGVLWREKLAALERFAELTDGSGTLKDSSGLLDERESIIAAVECIDRELADCQPPAVLRQAMLQTLTEAAARDTLLRHRLEQALQERAQRLLAAASRAATTSTVVAPRFIDRQA